MHSSNHWFIAAAASIGLAMNAHAAKTGYYAEAGIEHDSNLTVDELEGASGESDQAFLLGVGGEVSGQPIESLTLTAAYDFTSRQYDTLDTFDQDVHLASVDIGYDIGSVTIGASHHYSHAVLDAEPFLDYHRSSVYLGKLIDDDLYVTGSLINARKSFDNSDARDAHISGASLEGFFFFNGTRTLLASGLQVNKEDARADEFDYQVLAVHTRLKHQFGLLGQQSQVQTGLRYETRDYDEKLTATGAPIPVIGRNIANSDARSNRIVSMDVSWAVDLTEWLTTEAKVEHFDYRSPMDSAEYDKTLASLTVRANF